MNTLVPFSKTVELIRQRDPRVWSALLRRNKVRLAGYAHRNGLFGSDDIADLVNRTFVVLMERLDDTGIQLSFENEAKLDAYILKIFINLTHNELRKKGRHSKLHIPMERIELPDDEDSDYLSQPDALPAVEAWYTGNDPIDEQERIAQMGRALESLSPDDRELLMLWAQGYSYVAIAEILNLGIAVDSLKVRVHRAKLRVSRWFAEHTQKIALI
ncbi:RNA polymerase sigma factor [Fibrella sp. WM1]|uniref:RNA polymerase sigma factor n=1 Tax=Fibrella musci TaxID=3242485 RepID=UPI003520EE94